jgi:Transmembrane domain of unknown function (DUF3566)
VNKGNAEQPSAQTPEGHSSPSRVETVSKDRQETSPQAGPGVQASGHQQGSPRDRGSQQDHATGPQQQKPGPQGQRPTGGQGKPAAAKPPGQEQQSSNGQNKDGREELAAARTSASPEVTARGSAGSQSPGTAVPPAPVAGRSPGNPSSGPPVQARKAQSPSTQQRPEPPTGQAANTPTQARPAAAAPTTSAPTAPTVRPPSGAIPIWDPPAPPRQSLFSRLGLSKKPGEAEGYPVAPPAAPQAGTPMPPGTQAQPGTQPRLGGQPVPQPPARQPSMPQSPGRTEDATGRTPPVPGVRPTPAAQPGPQARVPGPPIHPGAPGPFPIPAPVQALKETTTGGIPAVTGVPGAATPEAHLAAKPKVGVARRTRKARLRLSRLDPWSVMKTSFLFSIAAGIMLVVAVYSIWTVLSTSHLFESINEIVRSVVSTPGDTTPFRIQEYVNTQKVMGVTALIACVDVVIFTALATLGSFLYNLAATMLGGLEITLAED